MTGAPEGRYTYGGPGWNYTEVTDRYDFDGTTTLRFNELYAPLCAVCGDQHPRAMKCYRHREIREAAIAAAGGTRVNVSVWGDTVVEAVRRAALSHKLDTTLERM